MTDFPRAFSDVRFDDSLIACITTVAERGVPMLALGQTVFWDELLKSMIVEAARQHAPDLKLIAGAHDTDYFSKLPEPTVSNGGFSLQPRDDLRTSQMWAAVAETSALLGTEYPVTRAELRAAGIPLRRLARKHPDGPEEFYREATMAWGWRGVANHSVGRTVACDIGARVIAPTVKALMEWAIGRSKDVLVGDSLQEAADRLLAAIKDRIDRCGSGDEEATLTDLYVCLLRGFYAMLLGELPEQVEVTASTEMFLFGPQTWDRPMFDVVDIFLDPETRPTASEAYDSVMGHTGIYRLEQFGEGAIPFDMVICGRGRGTIRVMGNHAVFDMPEGPVETNWQTPITDRRTLMQAAMHAFGCDDMRLVGKAVVLPTMLSREFTMVLLENASVYLPQTHRFMRLIRRAGIDLELNPLVRLHFETYDAMAAADATLHLPEHLAPFFGRRRITTGEFAREWRSAVARARATCEALREARSPEEILETLADAGEDVEDLTETYDEIARRRRASGSEIGELCERSQALWVEIKQILRAANAAHEAPPEERLQQLREEREAIIERALGLANSPDHLRLQERYHDTVLRIQQRKLEVMAAAHRTIGLEMSNYRPPWWWFLAVDPSGRWLRRLAETATMRFEPFGMMV